ncbi:hypothetical protein Tco_0814842 [Tanacetum coccineum]
MTMKMTAGDDVDSSSYDGVGVAAVVRRCRGGDGSDCWRGHGGCGLEWWLSRGCGGGDWPEMVERRRILARKRERRERWLGTSSVNKSSSPIDNFKQQDTPPTTNIQSSTELTTLKNVNAEENNDNQAADAQFQQDEFVNPFCTIGIKS